MCVIASRNFSVIIGEASFEMADRPFLVVATPCYGGLVTTAYAHSLLCLQQACRANGVELTWLLGSSDALITRARADLVTTILEIPEATHLLFIDADIAFEPKQVFRLMSLGADVAAGAYPLKAIDWDKVRRAIQENRPRPDCASLHYVFGLEDPSHIVVRQGFAKARNVGNGFLMVRREAIVKMCAAYPQLQYRKVHARNDARKDSPNRFALFETMIDKETGEYLSEDYAFCRRWRDLGGEIWLDLESKLTHVGPMRFVGDLSTQFDPPPAASPPR
jgi:hypothetical protein